MEFNSSLQLGLSMTLYMDESYTYSYKGAISLELEDTLFFEVSLQTNSSFASDVLLQVESCWATESNDPQDAVHGVLLQEGYLKMSQHSLTYALLDTVQCLAIVMNYC